MDDELDFKEYLNIVGKYWGWTLLVFILVFGAIATYTFLSEPVYEAKSLVVLTSQDQANFLLGSSAPKASDIELQKVVIQSPNVIYPILKDYGETFDLEVTNIKNSNILEITVQTNNPDNAMLIANRIADEYINYTAESRRTDAENTIEFISDKIKAYDKELNMLDLEATYYRTNNKTLTRQEQLEYQSLQREIVAKTKIYDSLLSKREEAAITANIESINVKVIQFAEYPELPVKPNKPLNLALGFILALGAGVGAAILADSMKPVEKKKVRF